MSSQLNPPRYSDWFAYFPQDYRWSAAMSLVLGVAASGASDLGEADRVGRQLQDHLGDDDEWFRAWAEEGERLFVAAEAAEASGHRLTAASRYLRSVTYHQIGERFRTPKDEAALQSYRRSLDAFSRYAKLTDRPRIEAVEVPYLASSLPAYLVHAETGGQTPPVVVFFDGLDITKEMCYQRGAEQMARRGISVLVVDGPGNGESIRFRGHYLRHDYELAGGAALDYLEGRGDVDAGRAGVLAISLGGYYASRCASMEPRFKAAVAWGAIWDYHATWKQRIEAGFQGSLSVPGHHLNWVMGTESMEEALHRLEGFRLESVMPRMRCPFLVLHGEHDEQVPLTTAERLYQASGSADKELHVFRAEEGGGQHCQSDQLTAAVEYFSDWLADRLQA